MYRLQKNGKTHTCRVMGWECFLHSLFVFFLYITTLMLNKRGKHGTPLDCVATLWVYVVVTKFFHFGTTLHCPWALAAIAMELQIRTVINCSAILFVHRLVPSTFKQRTRYFCNAVGNHLDWWLNPQSFIPIQTEEHCLREKWMGLWEPGLNV